MMKTPCRGMKYTGVCYYKSLGWYNTKKPGSLGNPRSYVVNSDCLLSLAPARFNKATKAKCDHKFPASSLISE